MLSFIVPAFNAAATVGDSIRSILDQELACRREVVVVDDCSVDDTWSVLRVLREEYPDDLRISRNRENLGGGATRNRAIELAAGDVYYVLDSDNLLSEGVVQAQLDCLTETGAQAVSVEEVHFFRGDRSGVVRAPMLHDSDGRSGLRELFASSHVPAAHGNYLFTRTLLEDVGGYATGYGAMDAWTFGMKHVVRGYDVAIAAGTFYLHRDQSTSYWVREERRGTNDRHAIAALREELANLPSDLREKVAALRSDDAFFALLKTGAFTPSCRLPSSSRRRALRARRRIVRFGSRGKSLLRASGRVE